MSQRYYHTVRALFHIMKAYSINPVFTQYKYRDLIQPIYGVSFSKSLGVGTSFSFGSILGPCGRWATTIEQLSSLIGNPVFGFFHAQVWQKPRTHQCISFYVIHDYTGANILSVRLSVYPFFEFNRHALPQ